LALVEKELQQARKDNQALTRYINARRKKEKPGERRRLKRRRRRRPGECGGGDAKVRWGSKLQGCLDLEEVISRVVQGLSLLLLAIMHLLLNDLMM
jgi:hypothetical protein